MGLGSIGHYVCAGVVSSKQTIMTTLLPTHSLSLSSSHQQKDVPQTRMLVMTAVFSFLIMVTVLVIVILLLLRQLKYRRDHDLFTDTETRTPIVDHPKQNHDLDATPGLLTPSPVKGIPQEIMPSRH